MKKVVEDLRELAEDYVLFARSVRMQQTHNILRGNGCLKDYQKEGHYIKLYLSSDFATWSLYLPSVEVTGYTQKITMNWDYDLEELREEVKDARNYLNNFLLPNIAKLQL